VDDPWGAFADDQIGLMDHLGINEFFFLGCCIGGPFVLKAIERAPNRILAGVLCQPVGHRPENPDVMYNSGRDVWAPELMKRRPDITQETIDQYLYNLYRRQPDFVYSVTRDFVKNCQTPLLVMPDDVPAHPYQTCVDVLELAPNSQVTIYPWKDTPELKAQAVEQARAFLKAHEPATARA
jgi:pimeloyl-ACP methyl ester carboxylesterase